MDENLKFGLTLFAGAMGGAIVAGLFAFVGAWIANKREHRQWLRNERLRAYETYLTETRPWAIARWVEVDLEMSKESQAALLSFQLVATKNVLNASRDLDQTISDLRTEFRQVLEGKSRQMRTIAEAEERLKQHLGNIDMKIIQLGKAMRRSLGFTHRQSRHWVSLLTEEPSAVNADGESLIANSSTDQ